MSARARGTPGGVGELGCHPRDCGGAAWRRAAGLCLTLALVFVAAEGARWWFPKRNAEPVPGSGPVVVVRGRVARPGVQACGAGDTVGDVLDRAGGGGRAVAPATRRRPLRPYTAVAVGEDGQVRVWELTPTEIFAVGGTLDPNVASPGELAQVPGISDALAERVIEERATRPFCSVDELVRVRGIGHATAEALRPFLSVGWAGEPCSATP